MQQSIGTPLLVAHPVRRLEERRYEVRPKRLRHLDFLHCLGHARHPLITLDLADCKWKVACTQHRMAEAVGIEGRAAEPSRQKQVELLARVLLGAAMDCP